MKLQRLKAIAKKELIQVWRDPRSLMIVLLMPLMQMALLGYGVSLDIQHVPVCTYDRDGSQQSQGLLKLFEASPYFQIVRDASSYHEVSQALDRGDCKIAIVVPPDFSQHLDTAQATPVQALLDATDDNTASIAMGYAQAVIQTFSAHVQLLRQQATGQPPLKVATQAQSRVWFNEDLESRNFVIPGIVAMVLALVGAQLTSLTLSREWERGTMEVLISTPVTRFELMLGKIAPYFLIGMLDAALCLSIAVFWFQAPFNGAVTTLILTTALFLLVVLGLGYLISAGIRSQVGASQVALLVTMLPTTLLSGFTFPIDQMPAPIRAITFLVHSRYYVTILKSIFLKGSSLLQLGLPILMLVIYAAIIGILATRAFRKTLD